jgi:phage terminase large subunit-like protein
MDELHVYKDRRMLEAMLSGMIGREQPLLVAITTAGESKSGVWWEIRKEWEKDPHALVVWYGASETDDPHDPKVWRKANPASWITLDMLERQHDALPMRSFERYHLNRFPQTRDASAAVSARDVAKCVKQPSAFDFEKPYAIGVDGAQSGDAFAILCVQRDGEFWDFHEYVYDEPPESGFYDLVQIEELVAELYTRGRPLIAIDPARLLLLAQHLDESYGVPLVAVPQTNKSMCPASALIVNAVRSHTARLGGCPKLAEHLQNAVLLEREPFGERLSSEGKGPSKRRIDAAIAAAIGMYAVETQDIAPSFAETGGIYSIALPE